MEFGKVSINQLAQVDFTLAPDPELTTAVLNAAKNDEPLQVYVGLSSWGCKEWKGNLFPPKTRDANFLTEYARQLNCVELNATYYQMYTPERIAQWKERTAASPEFKFLPKFNQLISHVKRLKNADDITTSFYESMLAFEEKLGPMFLQLNDNFSPNSYTELKQYLQSLPQDLPVFTELRHREWFAGEATRNQAFEMMHNLNIGAIITDTAGRRDVVHMHLPTPHAFIRFVGNGLHPTDYLRIDEWVERLKQWRDKGLQSIYLGMHQPDETAAPILADYFIEQLNKHLGLQVKRPHLIPPQQSLF